MTGTPVAGSWDWHTLQYNLVDNKYGHYFGQPVQGLFTLSEGERDFFFRSLLLLSVNIELDSLWTYLEVMLFSLKYKRSEKPHRLLRPNILKTSMLIGW